MTLNNQVRLAKIAINDTYSGHATALTLANRIKSIFGTVEAGWIVSKFYHGAKIHKCRECDQEYIDADDCANCCAPDEDEDYYYGDE